MGANFIYSIIPDFTLTDERKKILEENIDKMTEHCHLDHLEDIKEIRKECKRILNNCCNLYLYRDVAQLTLNQTDYLITGGMSWGDDPTMSFCDFNILNEIPDFWNFGEQWSTEDLEKRIKKGQI